MKLAVDIRMPRADFTLQVAGSLPNAGITAIFGPSGSGKTSLLRVIAGLEPLARGLIRYEHAVWQDDQHFMPAHLRPVGFVYQDARLFPHLSVKGNLEYAARRAARAGHVGDLQRVAVATGVTPLLSRAVDTLSAGQRQRVAIARALLTAPRLLLMDEPLGNLDGAARLELLEMLERLHGELGLPILYVSHSLDEVLRLADDLLLLERGQVRAAGRLAELLTRSDLPLAHLLDAAVVLLGTVRAQLAEHALSSIDVGGQEFLLPTLARPPGAPVRLRIDARDVSIALDEPRRTSISNVVRATIIDLPPGNDPAQQLVRLAFSGGTLLARLTRRSVAQLGLEPGQAVFAQLKSVALLH